MESNSYNLKDMMIDLADEASENIEQSTEDISEEMLRSFMDTCKGIAKTHLEESSEDGSEICVAADTTEGYKLQLKLIESAEDMSTLEKLSEIRTTDIEHLRNEQTSAQIKVMLDDNRAKNDSYVILAKLLVGAAHILTIYLVKNPATLKRIGKTCRLLVA